MTHEVNSSVASVLVADDHPILRFALGQLLSANSGFRIVGEAGSADETLVMVEERKPDLLILDLALPGKSGLEVITAIKSRNISVSVLVLSMYDDETHVRKAISTGAAGYLSKDSSPEQIISGLRQLRMGKLVIPAYLEFMRAELESLQKQPPAFGRRNLGEPLNQLSNREREIFFMLVDGSPNRIIAQKLYISPRTVETHRARIIRKLGVASTAGLIRYALKNELVSL